jgi:hypothetical protein
MAVPTVMGIIGEIEKRIVEAERRRQDAAASHSSEWSRWDGEVKALEWVLTLLRGEP